MTETNDNYQRSNALELLAADGPAPSHADKLMLYGQFVGSWDIHSTNFNADGTRTERQGEWHFAWVLGGRGVQDVLFASGAPAHKYGTTLRCYDETHDVWRVSWMAPGGGEFANLIGCHIGDCIVQEGAGLILGGWSAGPSQTSRPLLSPGEVKCLLIKERLGR